LPIEKFTERDHKKLILSNLLYFDPPNCEASAIVIHVTVHNAMCGDWNPTLS
jgi:hypothetical protein